LLLKPFDPLTFFCHSAAQKLKLRITQQEPPKTESYPVSELFHRDRA